MTKNLWPKKTALLLALLSFPVTNAAGETIRLKDKTVSVPERGFAATPRKDVGLVAMLYQPYGVAVMLPYSGSWKFELEEDSRITGEDETYSFTLAAWEGVDAAIVSDRDYLETILENLSDSALLVRDAELLEVHGGLVLRYRSQPKSLPKKAAKRDPWWWHYWSALNLDGRWVDLHFTVLEPSAGLPASATRLTALLSTGLLALPEEALRKLGAN